MTIRSPYPDIDIPEIALTDFVLHRARELGDKIALVCGATGRSFSYRQLADAIPRVAAGLHARGIRKGQVVGIVSPNIPEFALAFLAVASLGAICSTVNPIATAEEIGAQFADSEALMIITVPQLLEKCQTAARLAATVGDIVVIGEATNGAIPTNGAIAFASLFEHGNQPPHVAIDARNDVVALPYSSGTSGIPKGVMLTHYNLVANLVQCNATVPMVREDDRLLGVLPFFHIYGMVVIMCGALYAGATVVTLPRFDLEQCLDVIQKHRITYANVVPPIILAFAKHPLVDKYDLSSLRALFSGAAPLSDELATACTARLAVAVRQGYGLTETSPVTHFHPIESEIVRYGSVGPAVANTECRIVDPDTGLDVPPGERGELWIRGPQVMKGYFNKPEATAACMTHDGWFITGDVAMVDKDNWFYIVDRVKELIKFNGWQVAPAELEAVLLSHPSIADAAVIPVPDDDAGEVPKAFVVLRGELSGDEIMKYVAERVSPYKKIRVVEITDTIPKSPSGKILRRLLVEKERNAARVDS